MLQRPSPGTVIGAFSLTRVLGSGAQGQVWHGTHLGCAGATCPCLGDGGAVKLFLPGRVITAGAIEELEREARILERVSPSVAPWPYITPYFGYYAERPALAIGLGVAQIFDFLAVRPFPEPMARAYMQQLLRTLHHIHEKRVAHRVRHACSLCFGACSLEPVAVDCFVSRLFQ